MEWAKRTWAICLGGCLLAGLAWAEPSAEVLTIQEKAKLETLVDDNAYVARVRLGKGSFTGALNVHDATVKKALKGDMKTGSLFAHLDADDAALPAAIQAPKRPMATLPPGEYLVIVYRVEIVNSFPGIELPLIGTVFKPKRSYNYFIQRDDTRHCAWSVKSPEAAYVRHLCAGR